MDNKFYLSSLAFNNYSLNQIIEICHENNFNLEFSSNLPHNDKNLELFKGFRNKKLIHNYFPAPKQPFVINLASTNKSILKKSVKHCKQNILRTSKFDLPFYAVHAGFCLDPQILDLGGKIVSSEKKINRKLSLDIFIESLKELTDYAVKLEVDLYIENNVLSLENYESNHNQNIFLCTDYDEIKFIMDQFNIKNFGLLLDTGHLKVSSKTLNLDLNYQAENILKYTRAIHHSDNDGLRDVNLQLDQNYWFLPFMKNEKDLIHVIEVKNLNYKSVLNQIKILNDEL